MRHFAVAAFLVAICATASAQVTHKHMSTQIIDGSKTPELIPNTIARRLFFYTLSVPPDATVAEIGKQASIQARSSWCRPQRLGRRDTTACGIP